VGIIAGGVVADAESAYALRAHGVTTNMKKLLISTSLVALLLGTGTVACGGAEETKADAPAAGEEKAKGEKVKGEKAKGEKAKGEGGHE
jgi:hypothetical protein